MKKEKYGFVYIWYDKRRKLYYIGSHWGTEDDGYICSSNRMLDAYRIRPQDFKRRIIEVLYGDRSKLYESENKWLSYAQKSPDRYYNLVFAAQHWIVYPENVKTIREKISHRTREAMARPETREKLDKHYDTIRGKKQPKELVEKRRQSMIKTMSEKFPDENRRKSLTEEERFEYYSQKGKDIWSNRTEDEKKLVGRKISEGLKGKRNRLGHTNSEEHRRKISDAQKGKTHHRHRIVINDVEHESATKASIVLNISAATISRRLKSDKYSEYYRLG